MAEMTQGASPGFNSLLQPGWLTQLLDHSPEAIWITHTDGKLTYANTAAHKLLGYDSNELNTRPFMTLFSENSRAHDWMESALTATELPKSYEFHFQKKSGSAISRMGSYQAIKLPEAGTWGVMITLSNEHELPELHAALRIREDFLNAAGHELRTPLTSLKLQLQVLMRTVEKEGFANLTEERLQKILTSCNRQTETLTAMIDHFLDASRIANGRLAIEPTKLGLSAIVERVLTVLAPSLSEAGCKVTLTSDSEAIGYWDRSRVEQVASSLISNAMKYGAGKPIFVHVGEQEGLAQLTVQDQGVGISEETQTRIFDRFEKNATATRAGGLGLGLFIVKQIVLAHRGSISVESALGKGAIFSVKLPTHVFS